MLIYGFNFDWYCFNIVQVIDFCCYEIVLLKVVNVFLLVIINFMEYFYDYDYWQLVEVLDFIFWDSYLMWYCDKDEIVLVCYIVMYYDMMCSLKGGKLFVLMEFILGVINWQLISKLKKLGMYIFFLLQVVVYGVDLVQYFQWWKSCGLVEKFYGVVVDYVGYIDICIGCEVCQFGEIFSKLLEVRGCCIEVKVVIIFDQQNCWVLDDVQGLCNFGMEYEKMVNEYYCLFWEQGIVVDVIDVDVDLMLYQLVIVLMLYMVCDGFVGWVEVFVVNGGYLVIIYWIGIVNEFDFCYFGGFLGLLCNLLGIWVEEIDCLNDGEFNLVQGFVGNQCGLQGFYQVCYFCELIYIESVQVLVIYWDDFYVGWLVVMVNVFGKGKVWYVVFCNDLVFQCDFFIVLSKELVLLWVIVMELLFGVVVIVCIDGDNVFIFLQNYSV